MSNVNGRAARAMLGYAVVSGCAAVTWLIWAVANKGFEIPRRLAWLETLIFCAYIFPFIFFPQTQAHGRARPAFAVSDRKIRIARLLIAVSIANVIFWPVAARVSGEMWMFLIILPAQALFASSLNGVKWALGLDNVFTPRVARWWSLGGLDRVIDFIQKKSSR